MAGQQPFEDVRPTDADHQLPTPSPFAVPPFRPLGFDRTKPQTMNHPLRVFLTPLVLGLLRVANAGELPDEILTPEFEDFLQAEQGERLWADAQRSLREEQEANMQDPALAEYFEQLQLGNDRAAFDSIKGPTHSGHPQAQTELAHLYLTGRGTAKNLDKAVEWYHVASDRGNAMATSSLAAIYLAPEFGRQDLATALGLYKRCALRLRATCLANLSRLYAEDDSPEFDLAKAHAWASIAVAETAPGAEIAMAELAPRMDEESLQAAAEEKRNILRAILAAQ